MNAIPSMPHSAQQVRDMAAALPRRFRAWQEPRAFVQLGAGFEADGLLDEVQERLALSDLGLASARPSAVGAALEWTLGRIGTTQILVGHGHRYVYEGGGLHESVLPVAAAGLAGIRDLVLLEPGCTLREDLKCGTWMAATDYVNALGQCPAEGLLELFPDPFLDMADALSQSLNAEIINAAARTGIVPRLGVYQATAGPQFDTPAEAEAARRNGADMLGHGVVPETVLAALLGCRVAALVLAAEPAATYHGRPRRRTNLLEAARFCSPGIMRALRLALAGDSPVPPTLA